MFSNGTLTLHITSSILTGRLCNFWINIVNSAFNQEAGNIMIEGTGTSDLDLTLMESPTTKLLVVVKGSIPLKVVKAHFLHFLCHVCFSAHSKVERKFSTPIVVSIWKNDHLPWKAQPVFEAQVRQSAPLVNVKNTISVVMKFNTNLKFRHDSYVKFTGFWERNCSSVPPLVTLQTLKFNGPLHLPWKEVDALKIEYETTYQGLCITGELTLGTSNGTPCVFPFEYKIKLYYSW